MEMKALPLSDDRMVTNAFPVPSNTNVSLKLKKNVSEGSC